MPARYLVVEFEDDGTPIPPAVFDDGECDAALDHATRLCAHGGPVKLIDLKTAPINTVRPGQPR